MLVIWYRGNSQFGYVIKSQIEIGIALRCNQSTVSRNLKILETKKYLVRHVKHKLIKLAYFPLFLTDVARKMHSKNYADLNEVYVDMHKINAELHEKYAILQQKRGQNTTQSFNYSSKDDLNSLGNSIEYNKGDIID